MKTFNKKKFCLVPQETYSGRFYRNGFAWFSFVYQGVDGKWFKEPQAKPRIKTDINGRFISICGASDPISSQQIEVYRIKCNGIGYGYGRGLLGGLS